MATVQVCSVRDGAVMSFMAPFFVPHIGQATRGFIDAINNAKDGGDLFKHAADMELYHLGTFDDQTGKFMEFDTPVRLIRGVDCKSAV